MTDVSITWLIVALMIGIIIGNANIEIPSTDDISSLTGTVLDFVKNEPPESPDANQSEIEFYEFYAVGDDLWGAWYEIGDEVTSIKWFNDTIGHSFTGEVVSVNYRGETVIVRTFDESKVSGIGGGGITHQVKYQKLMRENVWTSTRDSDYIRYEWVQFVDSVIRAEIDDSMVCIDYTVDRMWVKPVYSACLPVASIIDENNTEIENVFLLD